MRTTSPGPRHSETTKLHPPPDRIPVATPHGFKPINELVVGEEVLVGHWTDGALSWGKLPIEFSHGTDPDTYLMMMRVRFGAGQELIVTHEHLFLMVNGKFKRADKLVAGKDWLVNAEGAPVALEATIDLGEFQGDIKTHNIAVTSFCWSLEGLLINMAGIVCGDWNAQIYEEELEELRLIDKS